MSKLKNKNLPDQKITLTDHLEAFGKHHLIPRPLGRLVVGYSNLLQKTESAGQSRSERVAAWNERVESKTDAMRKRAEAKVGASFAQLDAERAIDKASKSIETERTQVLDEADKIIQNESQRIKTEESSTNGSINPPK